VSAREGRMAWVSGSEWIPVGMHPCDQARKTAGLLVHSWVEAVLRAPPSVLSTVLAVEKRDEAHSSRGGPFWGSDQWHTGPASQCATCASTQSLASSCGCHVEMHHNLWRRGSVSVLHGAS
jgi:hypothetical protein